MSCRALHIPLPESQNSRVLSDKSMCRLCLCQTVKPAAAPQVIVGAVNVLSTLVAVFGVDRLGRRVLLLEAGVQMFIAEILVAILLGHYFASARPSTSAYPGTQQCCTPADVGNHLVLRATCKSTGLACCHY